MAKLVFGMNQSLDGYVDHTEFAPDPVLFRHFVEEAQGQTGSLYGRRTYELMRYWEGDDPAWDDDERAFAAAWQRQPKWVVSHSLESVGPGATRFGSLFATVADTAGGAGGRARAIGRGRSVRHGGDSPAADRPPYRCPAAAVPRWDETRRHAGRMRRTARISGAAAESYSCCVMW